MLIHQCVDCGSLSINRIAADDDPDSIMDVFYTSQALGYQERARCKAQGIVMLNDLEIATIQLYGQNTGLPAITLA